jgi:hypothetical protein
MGRKNKKGNNKDLANSEEEEEVSFDVENGQEVTPKTEVPKQTAKPQPQAKPEDNNTKNFTRRNSKFEIQKDHEGEQESHLYRVRLI